ncbi:MAG: DNA alkylation repair protein, partial [Bacteroidales bacterium]|nr:DNA alkylation repair protein [Bacteroidales bacterium]
LAFIINSLNGGNEFFINKAIGWILREYGKVNPEWVIQFCSSNKLSKLSEREALRIIIRN